MWADARVSSWLRLSLLQGLHDQPRVQSQWLLPAECRHHLLQPVPVQFHDFQVEGTPTWTTTPSMPLFCSPLRGSTPSCFVLYGARHPSDGEVSEWKRSMLAQTKSPKKKNDKKTTKRNGKPKIVCTKFKGLFFPHKGHVFVDSSCALTGPTG